ncbi:MAG: hypothetical protein NVSMB33_09060 [Ktedonobacteraceae bacterium]
MVNAQALIGTMLGTCTLQKLVEQGVMGTVFLAQQSNPPRQVAVKVITPATPLSPAQQTGFLERFRQEIPAVASLKHQNILPIYEYGEQDELAYLIMPYIGGGTLRHVLEQEGPLSFSKAADYLNQLAAALDFAHQHGVTHRDVRPATVLKTPDGRLLLTDFGLVKIVVEEQTSQMRLLNSETPVGMLEYMAPEQVMGDVVDAQTDLYALGVILYQMITGRMPFQGETLMQVATQLIQKSPPAPRSLRKDLSPAAEQVMLRAIAKRPADRYASAQDFANEFRIALTAVNTPLSTLVNKSSKEIAGTSIAPSIVPTSAPIPPTFASSAIIRSRGLFAPTLQKVQEAAKSVENSTPGMSESKDLLPLGEISSSPLAEKPAVSTGKSNPTDLLSARHTSSFVPAGETATLNNEAGKDVSLNTLSPTRNTPLPSIHPRLGLRTGLLRSTDEAAFPSSSPVVNEKSTSAATGQLPFSFGTSPTVTPQASLPGWPLVSSSTTNTTRTLSAPDSEQGITDALVPPKSVGANPQSPVPAAQVTGALTLPNSEPGNTGSLKLTEAVKLVQVPVAGQPGHYLTGFLPVLPQTQQPQPPQEPYDATGNTQLRSLKKWQKISALALIILIVLSVAGTLLLRLHSNARQSTTIAHNNNPLPDLQATFASQATATATANIILIDPLSQNIHNWLVSSTGNKIYVFKDGAYHIINNDPQQSAAPALLGGINIKVPMAYSLTMTEIHGDDNSINNSFGMIFRFHSAPMGSKSHTTFYTFQIVNTSDGEYQFSKYDDIKGPLANPYKTIWHHTFGKEFHQGQGSSKSNNVKIVVNGKSFTFFVNGHNVGFAQDSSLTDGEVGMLVNLKGTEVAFSNLELTYV